MIKWWLALIIGAVTMVIGYIVGTGRALPLCIEAKRYAALADKRLEEANRLLEEAEEYVKRVKDEQQE